MDDSKNWIQFKPNRDALINFVLVFLIGHLFVWFLYDNLKKNEELIVQREAVQLQNQLNEIFNHSITATRMLAFLIENDMLGDYFNEFSSGILAQADFIDALQLVEGQSIVATYPLEGHEPTIGYEVLEVEAHRRQAMIALERRQLYFDGPFELVQGGMGIVGRLPVMDSNGFRGFTAVVIRMETLYEALGIGMEGINELFAYQFLKDTDDYEHSAFFKNDRVYDSGIYYKGYIPIGNWILYVKLINPLYLKYTILFSIGFLIMALVSAFFVRQKALQPILLQEEVEKRAKELDKANSDLKQSAHELKNSNKELEQFAFVVSHDLQEPLRMITNFMDRLDKKYSFSLDDKGRKYIFYALDGATRMKKIIVDLLAYSRVDTGFNELEDVNLNKLVDDYRVLRRRLIDEKKAQVITQKLPVIKTYRLPLVQVINILLDNGIIHSKDDTPPMVEIYLEETNLNWKFCVKDNGKGINENDFEKIFFVFQRDHENLGYKHSDGTGIGLAIAKKHVQRIGGQIWVESVLNEGSTFYFTVPKKD